MSKTTLIRWLVVLFGIPLMVLAAWSANQDAARDEAFVSDQLICGSQESAELNETNITEFTFTALTNSKAAFTPGDKETSTSLGIVERAQYEIVPGENGVIQEIGGEIWIRVTNGFAEGWEKLSHGCLEPKQ